MTEVVLPLKVFYLQFQNSLLLWPFSAAGAILFLVIFDLYW
jgi:hypothetical protein